MEPEGTHQLEPVPDAVLGRAVKDASFRRAVLENKGNKRALDDYLKSQGFDSLSNQAYAVLKNLNLGEVDRVLEEIDRRGRASSAGPEIAAS